MHFFRLYQNLKLGGIVLLFCLCVEANGQNATQFLKDKFSRFTQHRLQEKIFMHTDRNFYLSGDVLWFKLYQVDAQFHQPLAISNVAYVELLDTENKPILQSKIEANNGSGQGSLYLPLSVPSGIYTLRTYTNWMKNFGPDFFYSKRITIVNTHQSRPENQVAVVPPAPEINFFPEGGNLVYGMHSRIACKVTTGDGKGLSFTGKIIDENNTTAANFESLAFGMGSFYFTPQQGHQYKAIIQVKGNLYTSVLPQIYQTGYVMSLSSENRQFLTVQVQTNLPYEEEMYLIVHTRQQLKATTLAVIKNGKAAFTIDKAILGEGISQFTLFNAQRKPVCERLYFTYPSDPLQIVVSGIQPAYPERSKIEMSIQAMNAKQQPTLADLSMAVYRIDSLQQVDETNISAYLWLSSDLTGYIESPEYYFTNTDHSQTFAALDNLLLTQGWRRFRWEDVLKDNLPVLSFPPEIKGHIIQGKVISNKTDLPVAHSTTYLSIPGPSADIGVSVSDQMGNVRFNMKKMYGNGEIILQTDPQSDTSTHVEIGNPFSEQYNHQSLPAFSLSNKYRESLLDKSIATQVQNLYSGEKINQLERLVDTIPFYQKADETYFLDNYTRFTSMEEVMREYVMYMDVQKNREGFALRLLDKSSQQFFTNQPLILVDGVPFFDVNHLMKFDPRKIRKLDVVNHRYLLGSTIFSGIMNWSTYQSNLADFELEPKATVIDYEGLQSKREFYTPRYDTELQKNNHLPDFRNVLYWASQIPLTDKGEGKLSFFTSDIPGKYIVVIQGLTSSGQCGAIYLNFNVQ